MTFLGAKNPQGRFSLEWGVVRTWWDTPHLEGCHLLWHPSYIEPLGGGQVDSNRPRGHELRGAMGQEVGMKRVSNYQ